jgi:hypothetical protein
LERRFKGANDSHHRDDCIYGIDRNNGHHRDDRLHFDRRGRCGG